MTFPTTKQLVLMTLAWALALMGIDYAKNPRPWGQLLAPIDASSNVGAGTPIVTLYLSHMCLADVTAAMGTFKGLTMKPPRLLVGDPSVGQSGSSVAGEIDFEVSDLSHVDFMAIDRALRDVGLVAERMELRGPRHFRFEATMDHMCCAACAVAAKEGLELSRGLKSQGHLRWLDSFDVEEEKKLVVANARYDAVADVGELLGALNHAGFQPTSIIAVTSAEKHRAPPPGPR